MLLICFILSKVMVLVPLVRQTLRGSVLQRGTLFATYRHTCAPKVIVLLMVLQIAVHPVPLLSTSSIIIWIILLMPVPICLLPGNQHEPLPRLTPLEVHW